MDGARNLVPVALAATVALVAADITAYLVDYGAFHLRIGALNGDSENGAFQWLLIAVIAASAALAAGLALRERDHRRRLALLSCCLAVIALAETAHLRDSRGGLAIYVLALPVVAVLLVNVASHGPARRLMIVGLSCLAASLALHELGPPVLRALGWRYDSWGFQVKIALKESVELAGWLLVAFALASRVRLRLSTSR